MTVKKGKLLIEGKVKKVYSTNEPDYLILHFTDNVAGVRSGEERIIKNKGTYNNAISSFLFKLLGGYHIRTHFVDVLKPDEMLVRKLDIIPITVEVWNFAGGSFSKRYGIAKGEALNRPVVEFYLKNSKLRNPMITADHACAFGYAKPEEMQTIDRTVRKVNAVLKSFFDRRKFKLINFKLEFGRYQDKIFLSDEISPDTFSLVDMKDGETKNKAPLNLATDKITAAYEELKNRICK